MAKDVRIIPVDGDLQFYNTAASASGKIQQVNDDLVISNAVGDILFGDTNSDVYIGDGVSNVDIIFEQDGEIRGEVGSNVTLTLGSTDTTLHLTGSTLALQKDGGNVGIGTTTPSEKLHVNGTIQTDGDLYLNGTGAINFSGSNNTNLVEINGNTLIKQISNRGGIQIGRDDTILIGAGESAGIIGGQITPEAETVHIGAENGVWLYGLPSNGSWAARTALHVYEGGYVNFLTGSTTRARIHTDGDSYFNGGNVGIGISGPSTLLTLSANLNNSVTFARDIDTIGALVHGVGSAGAEMWLHRDDVTIGAGNLLGRINFSGADGGSYVGASIMGQAGGTWGTTSARSRLIFNTTSDGATSPSEKMRIEYDGSIIFNAYGSGTNTGTAAYNLQVDSSGNIIESALTVPNATSASYATNADTVDGLQASSFLRSDAADTATGLLTLNGGVHILSGTGGGKLRIKRNTGSTDGDDITDIHMDDGGIYFDIDNDNDGDSSNVTFRYKTNGSFTNLLQFTNTAITYKGNTLWHSGNDGPTSGLSAQTATTASYAGSVNFSDIIGAPASDNYGEWNLAGEADSTDVTSGKWVKFTGGASITGTGTEANPYVMTITPSNATTAATASYVAGGNVVGAVSSATSATNTTNFNVAADNGTNADHYIIFTGGATGNQRPNSDTGLKYNPSTNAITATTFRGTADNSITASHAETVKVEAGPAAGNYDVIFTDGAGNLATDVGGNFAYDNNTGTLNVTSISGTAGSATSASHAEYADDAGLATNARNVDVNNVTSGTGYRIVFADTAGTGYEQMYVHDNGIEYDPGTGTFRTSGDIVAYNNFSDRELKKNVQEYEGGLSAVMQLNPVTYEWKKGREGVEVGLIAQEVEEVVPHVVREQQRMDEGIYKTVDYEKLTAVLIDAVQDQQRQINELKAKLDGLTK